MFYSECWNKMCAKYLGTKRGPDSSGDMRAEAQRNKDYTQQGVLRRELLLQR